MSETKVIVEGFEDDFGRDLEAALWTLPNGTRVLCATGNTGGFVLYEADDWNSASTSVWEADDDGHVTRLGRYVDFDNAAWVVPAKIRKAAIS